MKYNKYWSIFLPLWLVFGFAEVHSQEVQWLDKFQNNQRIVPDSLAYLELMDLLTRSQTTLYIKDGVQSQFGATLPLRVIVDQSGFNALSDTNKLLGNVKLLWIQLERPSSLNEEFDFSSLIGVSGLKYIYFLCTFKGCPEDLYQKECESRAISRVIKGFENDKWFFAYTFTIDE